MNSEIKIEKLLSNDELLSEFILSLPLSSKIVKKCFMSDEIYSYYLNHSRRGLTVGEACSETMQATVIFNATNYFKRISFEDEG